MPTNGIHTFPKGQQKCHVRVIVNWQEMRAIVGEPKNPFQSSQEKTHSVNGGNCRQLLEACERIIYNTPFLTSGTSRQMGDQELKGRDEMAQGLLCIYHGVPLLSLYTDQVYWDERERKID
jgi:hypothetical protein